MTARVQEILSHYESDNPGTLSSLYRLLMSGALAGSGRLMILPVDQGFEHGPAKSFAPNAPGYDPAYHLDLALSAGFSAYACPLGFMESVARQAAGRIPLILKLNSHESIGSDPDSLPALTGGVDDALRLGCDAIGYTIYPGSAYAHEGYEQLSALVAEAKQAGLAVVVWSYPRGSELPSAAQTAVDVVAYAAQIAAQLGAHVIKVKPPTGEFSSPDMAAYYKKHKIPTATLADRIRHVVSSAFDGKRIVIFSGGAKGTDQEFLELVKGIKEGGGFGSIMGRNVFQRPRRSALQLAKKVAGVYAK